MKVLNYFWQSRCQHFSITTGREKTGENKEDTEWMSRLKLSQGKEHELCEAYATSGHVTKRGELVTCFRKTFF